MAFNRQNCIVKVQSEASTGTGFIVDGKDGNTYVLTCYHVVEHSIKYQSDVIISFYESHERFDLNNPIYKKVTYKNLEADIALIQLIEEDFINKNHQKLKLLKVDLENTNYFQSYGFPTDFHNGKSGGDKCQILNKVVPKVKKLFQLDNTKELRRGFSGGPLLHPTEPYVMGMFSDIESEDKDGSQPNHYALQAEYIVECFPEILNLETRHPYEIMLSSYYDEPLPSNPSIRLSDIYVDPYFSVRVTDKDMIENMYENCSSKFIISPDRRSGFHKFEQSLHERVNNILSTNRTYFGFDKHGKEDEINMIMLLGYPGQGKTSFVYKQLKLLFEQNIERRFYMIKLREIEDIQVLIQQTLSTIENEIIAQSRELLNNEKLDRGIWILDGLDEISINNDPGYRYIDTLINKLHGLSQDNPQLTIVITSRFGFINLDSLKSKRDIIILQISEFDKNQQIKWLKKYKKFNKECEFSTDDIESFHTNNKFQELKEMLTQPILLKMIVENTIRANKIDSLTSLYNQVIESIIIRNWAPKDEKNLPALASIDAYKLRKALQEIAHNIFFGSKGYINRTDLEDLKNVVALRSGSLGDIGGVRKLLIAFFMKDYEKSSQDNSGNKKDIEYNFGIEFLHEYMCLYFCAEHIINEILCIQENNRRNSDHDLDEFYLLFGKKRAPAQMIKYIFDIMKEKQSKNIHEFDTSKLTLFFEDFLNKNFIGENQKFNNTPPINVMVNIFYSYWTIISNVTKNHNSYIELNRTSFFQLLTLLVQSSSNIDDNNNLTNDAVNIRIEGSDLSNINLCNSYLKMSSFIDSTLINVNFTRAQLSFTNFVGAKLFEANLSEANLDSALMNDSKMHDTILFRTNLSNAIMLRVELYNATLIQAILINTDLSNAKLNQADLSNSNLTEAILVNSNFTDAILRNADLRRSNLSGADLSGADLSGADLSGADLSGADFKEAKNITLEQLSATKSLYKTKGLNKQIRKELQKNSPHLFKKVAKQ